MASGELEVLGWRGEVEGRWERSFNRLWVSDICCYISCGLDCSRMVSRRIRQRWRFMQVHGDKRDCPVLMLQLLNTVTHTHLCAMCGRYWTRLQEVDKRVLFGVQSACFVGIMIMYIFVTIVRVLVVVSS